MVVRIRFARGHRINKKRRTDQTFAAVVAALLPPAAAMALVLGIWGFAAELKWAASFCIRSGPLSHWQVWLGLAALLQLVSHYLNRYGHQQDRPPALEERQIR